jgi:hypothetical protein
LRIDKRLRLDLKKHWLDLIAKIRKDLGVKLRMMQDTHLDLVIRGSCRGLTRKPLPYLLPQAWAHRSNRRGRRRPWWHCSPALGALRVRLRCRIERRGRGELGGGLTIGRGVEGRPQSGRRRSASSPARLPVVAARQLLRGRAVARLASAIGTARGGPRPTFMGVGHAHGRGGGGLDSWPCPPWTLATAGVWARMG